MPGYDPNIIGRFAAKRPLAAFSMLYTTGAALGYYLSAPFIFWFTLAALILGALIWRLTTKRATLILVLLLALPIGATITCAAARIPAAMPGDDVAIEGTVSALPQVDPIRTVVTLSGVSIGGEPHGHSLRLYIYGDGPECMMGDTLSLTGDVWLPSGRRNPGGFDFRAWLWTRGGVLGATANAKDVTVTDGNPWSYLAAVGRIQDYLARRTDSLFPNDAALVKALVLGDKGSLSGETTDQFRMAGLSHLLAVSGLHVACLALLLEWLLLRLRASRRWAMLTTVIAVFLYAALLGFSPSIMRSWLMFTLVRGARAYGKPGDTLTGMMSAALILLIVKPLNIADVGFQLSFASVLGLIMLTGIMVPQQKPKQAADPDIPTPIVKLRQLIDRILRMIMSSIAVQLMTLPIVAVQFGSMTLIAPIMNLVAIPLMSIALPVSVMKLALGLNLGGLPDMLVSLMSTLARLASEANAPSVMLPGRGWEAIIMIGYFMLCFMASPFLKQPRWRRSRYLWLLSVPVALSLLITQLALTGGLNATFLDAGQAVATVVRAERHAYVFDTGKENGPVSDYLLWSGQVPEAVFLSHPHADHTGGLQALLLEMRVGTIYIPECWDRVEPDAGVIETLQIAEARGAKIVRLSQGDTVQLSRSVSLEVLQPVPYYQPKSGNGASMVMVIRYDGGSLMLTGDMPAKEELPTYPGATVLQAAHHGAKGSNSTNMLEQVSPSVLVIPVGRNSYGHPGQRVLDDAKAVGATVHRTDESGAVFADIKPDGTVSVSTFLGN